MDIQSASSPDETSALNKDVTIEEAIDVGLADFFNKRKACGNAWPCGSQYIWNSEGRAEGRVFPEPFEKIRSGRLTAQGGDLQQGEKARILARGGRRIERQLI